MVEMMRAVDEVLEEIGAGDRPRLLVLNKADALDAERREELRFRHPDGVLVSAADGRGPRGRCGDRVEAAFAPTLRSIELLVPYAEGARLLPSCTTLAGDLEREDTAEGVARPRARPRDAWPSATTRFAVDGRRRAAALAARRGRGLQRTGAGPRQRACIRGTIRRAPAPGLRMRWRSRLDRAGAAPRCRGIERSTAAPSPSPASIAVARGVAARHRRS